MGIIFLSLMLIATFLLFPYFLERALFFLLICCLFVLMRMLIGPGACQRIVAVTIISMLIIGFCGILAFFTQKNWYIDIALVWVFQSFIATLTFAKFLEGKRFDD